MTYTTLRGTRAHDAPPVDYHDVYDLPARHEDDDGAILVSGGLDPTCADCERGTLCWAEAGHVPWHRICNVCGSHWELHPVHFVSPGRAAAEPVELPPSKRPLVPPEQWDWRPTYPNVELPEGIGLDDLLGLALTAGYDEPSRPWGSGGPQALGATLACWARRARLY